MPGIQLMTVQETQSPNTAVDSTKQVKAVGLQGLFTNYMKQNSAGNAGIANGQQQASELGGTSERPKVEMQQQYEKYQSKASSASSRISDRGTSVQEPVDNDVVEEAVTAVKEIIKEELGLDDQQLEEAMAILGLTGFDLLDPKNLMQLTMELTDASDAGMLLLQDGVQDILQQTTAVTKELLQELGMDMEELLSSMDTAMEEAPQLTPQNQDAEMPLEQELSKDVTEEVKQDVHVAETIERKAEAPVNTAVQPQVTENAVRTEDTDTRQHTEIRPQEESVEKSTPVAEQAEEQKDNGQQAPEEENQQMARREETTGPERSAQQNMNVQEHIFTPHVAQQPAAAVVQEPQPVMTAPQVDVQNVIEQIVEYTRTNITDAVKSIEMQLNPENLGRIYLHVSEKQGAVTAQITTQNEQMKEALMQQAVVLRENLTQQGVKVDAVEVSVGTHEFEDNLERNAQQEEEQARQEEERRGNQRRTLNLNNLDDLSGLMSEEEELAARIMRDNGNSLDYRT